MDHKLSPKLQERAESVPDSTDVEVVLELKPPIDPQPSASRAERIKMAQESFEQQSRPVRDAIARLGGEVTGGAWVDSTIRAKLPRKALGELSKEENIQHIDDGVPRPLTRE